MAAGWSGLDEETWRTFGGVHRLLLRLAGQFPDELTTHLRKLLDNGDVAYLPDTLMGSAVELGISLRQGEVELLRNLLVAIGYEGVEPAAQELVSVSDATPEIDYRFAPVSPDVLVAEGTRIPATLDLTTGPPDDLADLADDLADLEEELVADLLSEEPGVVAGWRAWRFGPQEPPQDGRRVFLVEVDPDVTAWNLAAELDGTLDRAGERFPQVEVFWTGDDLPPYQRVALANAALLYTRQPSN